MSTAAGSKTNFVQAGLDGGEGQVLGAADSHWLRIKTTIDQVQTRVCVLRHERGSSLDGLATLARGGALGSYQRARRPCWFARQLM